MYYYREYKYQGKAIFFILIIVAFLLVAIFMLHLAYKSDAFLVLYGFAFSVEVTRVILAVLGIMCILGSLGLAYSGYFGWKIGRNIVLEADGLTFPKNMFSTERITKKYSEICSVLQLKNNGNVFVRVSYIDGTKCEWSRILFVSKEEYLDFISKLTELIKVNRTGQHQ